MISKKSPVRKKLKVEKRALKLKSAKKTKKPLKHKKIKKRGSIRRVKKGKGFFSFLFGSKQKHSSSSKRKNSAKHKHSLKKIRHKTKNMKKERKKRLKELKNKKLLGKRKRIEEFNKKRLLERKEKIAEINKKKLLETRKNAVGSRKKKILEKRKKSIEFKRKKIMEFKKKRLLEKKEKAKELKRKNLIEKRKKILEQRKKAEEFRKQKSDLKNKEKKRRGFFSFLFGSSPSSKSEHPSNVHYSHHKTLKKPEQNPIKGKGKAEVKELVKKEGDEKIKKEESKKAKQKEKKPEVKKEKPEKQENKRLPLPAKEKKLGKKKKLSDAEKSQRTFYNKSSDKLNCIKTGIPGFDELIKEGIPLGSSVLVEGGPGSGKTIFCLELAKRMCANGKRVLYMSFEEPEYRLRTHLKSFGTDVEKYEREKKLYVRRFNALDIARSVEALLSEAKKELLIDVQPVLIPHDFEPEVVLIDSLTSIGSAFSGEESRFRIYMEQLFRYLESHQITSFLIRETNNPTHIGTSFVEKAEAVSFLSDGIIALYNVFLPNGLRKRALEIVKMRGVSIERKIVECEIIGGKGIFIYPNKVLTGTYKLT